MTYRAWSIGLGIVVGIVLCSVASAQTLPQARPGLVSVVRITVDDPEELDALTKAGFDIANVRNGEVTIYATWREVNRLRSAGYSPVQVAVNPRTDIFATPTAGKVLGAYNTYDEMTAMLEEYASTYGTGADPDICRLQSLGRSVQNRELWALLITDNPDLEEDEPEFKYVSTIHGDEPVGTEMCLYFIDLLLTNYGTDARITSLVDETAIWIVPMMNPDGRTLASRYNAQGYDLNRSFPVYPADYTGNLFDGEPLHDEGRPPEVAHVMQWTAQNRFVLSANFHTGTLVVNYPYDEDGVGSGNDAPTPDDLLLEDVSLRYSQHNPGMWNSPWFPKGITNGSAWYAIFGGMQDWNYRYTGCNEVTIELSNTSWPPQSTIPSYWQDNGESMWSYIEAVHVGVRGVVTATNTGEPLSAKVTVAGNDQPVFTDPDVGDYHRMLLPGTYSLTFTAPGYVPHTVANVTVAAGPATWVDVALDSLSAGTIVLDKDYYTGADSVGIEVTDIDLQGAGTQDVLVETDGGDFETVTLLETGAGVFTGTISTSTNAVTVEDGTLQVVCDETLTAAYVDLDDGTGASVVVEDFATVVEELPGPAILSSFVGSGTRKLVKLRWATESESDCLEWNVFRSKNDTGPFVRINLKAIPGAGTTTDPQEYSFGDRKVTLGVTCYYLLQGVYSSGETYDYDSNIISVTPKK